MEWKQLPLGPLQTNCYLLIKNDSCLIVDPGNESEKIIQYIDQLQVKPLAILLTHAHYDHIGAVDVVRNHYQIDVYIHKEEDSWLPSLELNGGQLSINRADHLFTTDGEQKIGDFTFELLHTPGHSPGGVSFYFKNDRAVFTGDALFQRSIGRTDFRFGNHQQLLDSIQTKLLTLPEDTVVLPGHGPATTIGMEKSSNPFLS